MFYEEEHDDRFSEVWAYLNGDYPDEEALDKAQSLLDGMKERDAEWHYVQAAVNYYKRFYLDCRRQLKKAIKLDSANGKYRAALQELTAMADEAKKRGNPCKMPKRRIFASPFARGVAQAVVKKSSR